jgi:hypothetical protein
LKGLAAGLVAGLAASLVMNRFQGAWSRQSQGVEKSHGAQSLQPSGGGTREGEGGRDEDDATEKVASAISEGLLDRRLSEGEKEKAGTAVHYAYGAVTGAFYGAAAELAPVVAAGAGVPFGALVWLLGDEGAVPALGLSAGPAAYPASTHVYSVASHLIYGLTLEVVRRAVRRAL